MADRAGPNSGDCSINLSTVEMGTVDLPDLVTAHDGKIQRIKSQVAIQFVPLTGVRPSCLVSSSAAVTLKWGYL